MKSEERNDHESVWCQTPVSRSASCSLSCSVVRQHGLDDGAGKYPRYEWLQGDVGVGG